MKNDIGSFIEKSYFPTTNCLMVVGLAMGTALCAPSGLSLPTENLSNYHGNWPKIVAEERVYQLDAPTWSSVEQKTLIEAEMLSTKLNAIESLGVINKMAFLEVDEAIDNEIEEYFASKPIKTKTILVNPRIQQQG